jgi:hypothetical protein
MNWFTRTTLAIASAAAIGLPATASLGTAASATTSPMAVASHGAPYVPCCGGGGLNPWSGWNTLSASNLYTGAQETFYVPGLDTKTCGNHAVGVWTGLGGDDSTGNFIQSGIGYDDPVGNAWAPWFEMFVHGISTPVYEMPPASGNTAAGIHSGDEVTSVTYYNPSTEVASFQLIDHKTGAVWGTAFSKASSAYDGTTADFELEEPMWNGTNSATVQFSKFNISTADARTSAKGWVTIASQLDGSMAASDKDVVAEPGNLSASGNSFSETFVHCN